SRRIVFGNRKRRIEPELVCGRNGAERRLRVATKNDPAQVSTIDGHGDSFAKFRGAEPVLLVFRQRGGGHLIEPNLLRIEARTSIMSDRGCFLLQTIEVFGVESVDQMNFTAA